MNKLLLVAGILFFLIGLTFAFLPHETHNMLLGTLEGHTLEEGHTDITEEHGSHDVHQLFGVILLIIGLLMTSIGWKFF